MHRRTQGDGTARPVRPAHLVIGVLLLAAGLATALVPGVGPVVSAALVGGGVQELRTGLTQQEAPAAPPEPVMAEDSGTEPAPCPVVLPADLPSPAGPLPAPTPGQEAAEEVLPAGPGPIRAGPAGPLP